MSYHETYPYNCADVILPLAVPRLYSYSLPPEWSKKARVGMRVIVQLGSKKLFTGIIAAVHSRPSDQALKPILDLPDDHPMVSHEDIEFWIWLAGYYMCSLGEVMNAALPAGFKLESETRIVKNPEAFEDYSKLTDAEYLIVEALENRSSISISEASAILEIQNPMRVMKRLMDLGFVLLEEEIAGQATPKTFRVVTLARAFSEEELQEIFRNLEKSPKQNELLLSWFRLKDLYHSEMVPEKVLLQDSGVSRAVMNALSDKGVLKISEQLSESQEIKEFANLSLSPAQSEALSQIEHAFSEKKPVLLHGLTASGKTEIYISLIKKALSTHRRALYLVPEISLTTQLVNRLREHFGEQVVVYHSRLSERERLAAYNRVAFESQPLLLLGARSALLLPVNDLGIIVIDEEHDASFKQQNPAPRYQARDAAVMLAHKRNCSILLGSATPGLESYFHAREGKYQLVTLKERFGGVLLPEIQVIDIRKETLWKTMRGHFAPALVEEMQDSIHSGKKVIIFQNRRGYTPVIQCTDCGFTQMCKNCDITLTYHKYANRLKCHYCGYHTSPPPACITCGSTSLKEVGFGTERIEEEVETFLPDARIARMDLDSTRKKDSFAKLISRFSQGEIDVLIGTQMVTKGLDFDDVRLVGIVSADSLLHYPDFRAQERAFQLMEQVAGRAGRRNERGKVIIQTYRPMHHIIQFVEKHAYEEMAIQQLEERSVFNYPPYSRLIHISIRHKDKLVLDEVAGVFAASLRHLLGDKVLGPEYPPVSRLKNIYHKDILLKLSREVSPVRVKDFLWQLHAKIFMQPPYKSCRVVFDVDPY